MRIIRNEKPNVFDYCSYIDNHIRNMAFCPLKTDKYDSVFCSNGCEYYIEKGEDD